MTTKVFWSVHFSYPTQDITELVRLIHFIDSDTKSILTIIKSKENPPIASFLDAEYLNQSGLLNRVVLSTDDWGFPRKSEIEHLEEFLKTHYASSLFQAEHYLFGQSTQDCVARMGRAIAYGSGQSYSKDEPVPEIVKPTYNFPDLGVPVRPLAHVHFIEELCYPNKLHCSPNGPFSKNYCDFVRIYGANGRLQRKELISLDQVVGKR